MNLKSVLLFGAIAVCASTLANAQTAATPTAAAGEETCIGISVPAGQATSEKKAERIANRALARRVRKQLSVTQGLQDSEISVFATAKTGAVVLAGMISDSSQDQIATDAAKKVQGVNAVKSQLTIREEGGG
jgi:hyperosmotically inducible periplasmic protein